VKSTSSAGTLRRYDVRVEDGLSIDADEAALLIQGVLDDAELARHPPPAFRSDTGRGVGRKNAWPLPSQD
jgi:hypothetical protein